MFSWGDNPFHLSYDIGRWEVIDLREIEYQVCFRGGKKYETIRNVTELKVEGGAYLFYSGDYVSYSVPLDLVEEIISA